MRSQPLRQLSLILVILAEPALMLPAGLLSQEVETLVLEVQGLRDEHCEEFLGRWLDDLPGIDSIEADHLTGTVTVRFDPAQTNATVIAERIEDCSQFDVIASDSHPLGPDLLRDRPDQPCGRRCSYHRHATGAL